MYLGIHFKLMPPQKYYTKVLYECTRTKHMSHFNNENESVRYTQVINILYANEKYIN
jgi:hypothetical protein